jgi:hypothetical protein
MDYSSIYDFNESITTPSPNRTVTAATQLCYTHIYQFYSHNTSLKQSVAAYLKVKNVN